MEWQSWSSLALSQREQLPIQPGIYIVTDAEENIWYVGKSTNLNARWKGTGHHRYHQLKNTNKRKSYKIYWKTFPSQELNEKEQQYIRDLKPHLNYSQVKTYVKKSIQPNTEISRLLKNISKKTQLFPNLRSFVFGYYTEVEENEAGELEQCVCIVIVVNTNDHDRLILKSYQQSFTRKGKNLKDCWLTYESDCGIDDPEKRLAFIPVFRRENIIYEFVCSSDLITAGEEQLSIFGTVELEKQLVLALKDTNILAPFILGNTNVGSKYIRTAEDYMRYRFPDLQPIQNLLQDSLED